MVDIGAQDDGAERPHEKSGAEGRQRSHQGSELVLAGKECRRYGARVIAVDHEVVHLEEVSAGDADDRQNLGLALGFRQHSPQVLLGVPTSFCCRKSNTSNVRASTFSFLRKPWPSLSPSRYQTSLPRPRSAWTICSASDCGTRGSLWPCTTNIWASILSTAFKGEIRSCTARTLGSRSSPYSARRRSRR